MGEKVLKRARKDAGLSLTDVSGPMGRTHEWLRKIETGRISVSADVRKKILGVIAAFARKHERIDAAILDSEIACRKELRQFRLP
jgi:transcriptional regulator with XRE-family HTH domain